VDAVMKKNAIFHRV